MTEPNACDSCDVAIDAGTHCDRCKCTHAAADIIDQMLAIDASTAAVWERASSLLRSGDTLAALAAMASVQESTARARTLAEVAAIAIVGLIGIDENERRCTTTTMETES